jgi:tetratricopeptide (TPR) repeat protein
MPGPELPAIPGYRVVERLGAGASGAAFRAVREADGRVVVLKVLHRHLGGDAKLQRRFQRESRLVQRLDHPHIVTMLDVFRWNETQVLVMDHVEGRTLAAWVPGHGRDVPSLVERLGAVARVASALSYAHNAGVVHRDVKPGNVLVREDGQPLLIDFGLAHDAERDSRITSTGDVAGSPAYMSPEHYQDMKTVDARSDIWSLGITLFELASGTRPFEGGSRMSLMRSVVRDEVPHLARSMDQVPTGLDAVVQRALEKDPAHRYQDAEELARDLEGVARGEGSRGRGPGALVRRELRRVRRGRMAIALSAIGALVALLWFMGGELSARALENAVAEGRAALDYGDLDAALEAFARATEARPEAPAGDRWTAAAYLLFDRWADAAEAMGKAREKGFDPDADEQLRGGVDRFHAGVAAVLSEQWEQAARQLTEAVRLDPSLYEANQPLMSVRREQGAPDHELRALLQAAQRGLRPANPRSRIIAAQILELDGDLDGALAVLSELEASEEFQRSPHHGVHRHRGRLLLGQALAAGAGSPAALALAEQARSSLTSALARNPRDAQAASNLARALLAGERFEQAEATARALLASSPGAESGSLLLLTALTAQGRYDEAREVAGSFFTPAARDNALVRVDFLEGQHLSSIDREGRRQARDLFARCLELDPDFLAARIELGYRLNDLGEVGPAYETLLECLERLDGPRSTLDREWSVAASVATEPRVAMGLFLSGCGCEDEGRARSASERVDALIAGGWMPGGTDLANLVSCLAACEVLSVRDCERAEGLMASPAFNDEGIPDGIREHVQAHVESCDG